MFSRPLRPAGRLVGRVWLPAGLILVTAVVAVPVASAQVLPAASRAGHAVPHDISDEFSGILPICSTDVTEEGSPPQVFTNEEDLDGYAQVAAWGLDSNCAFQNWNEDGDSPTYTQAVTALATPDTVSISDHPTTVKLSVTAGTDPGPFNSVTLVGTCFPAASFGTACPKPAGSYGYSVAYREADATGMFSGDWTLAGAENNPWFTFTKTSDCASNYLNWASNYQEPGLPCTYSLSFATDQNGVPTLTRALEVVVDLNLDSGTQTYEGVSSAQWSDNANVPLLFTPGGSTSLTLARAPSTVRYGTSDTLTAHAVGPAKGSTIDFLSKPAGAAAFSSIGSGTTDAAGVATLKVTPKKNTQYEAQLAGSGSGAKVMSSAVTLTVSRLLSLKAKASKHKGVFTGHVTPAGPVLLQRLTAGRWKAVSHLKASASGALHARKALPKGASKWRLDDTSSAAYASSTSKMVTLRR